MATPVKMPRLGESVAEGTIGAWLKNIGDYVERDESIAEVVTDKINAELPSPVAGKIVKLLVQVDETVPVGTDIVLIEESADIPAETSPQAPSAAPGPDAAPVQKREQLETPIMEQREARTAGTQAVASAPVTERNGEEERQRISPLARRLAREHDLDLNAIQGTGINGRVRKEDILAYLEQRSTAQPVATATSAVAQQAVAVTRTPEPQPVSTAVTSALIEIPAGDDVQVITPSRIRLATAEHMVRSKRTSPHATAMVEVDMTGIAKWLEKNKEDFKRREGYAMSYVPFVIKAVCEGIRKYPVMNSSWSEDNKILIKRRINMGVAVGTETGLVVPTIYDADQYTLAGLAKQVNALAQRARNNKLTLQDMQGSTFVVNNTGVFGTVISIPIINQPHAGILAMNAVVKRPVVTEDDAIAIRYMMYLCLSFDHRLLDGLESGGFLKTVKTRLESYGREIDVY
ncbi:dihydrolipoamide acetyltransferase family protein [Ktedonobacter racemifer]|uniref:Dihydrolipoamide acetyltransferase component of pyruvate dehydrogenase complex n=1 Tax=Ktedonobacter racemifer DSM 44963 TaxID=485913 RepID=D6TJJ7_KTERA|nr:dihydrolipoamide acetyltransferase family protein [Ktedonobacter racemifer]EFH89604.1 catalytic domain of component of various dehydrogenase complexes [Ktedonobacter racemifer DSM 44963]